MGGVRHASASPGLATTPARQGGRGARLRDVELDAPLGGEDDAGTLLELLEAPDSSPEVVALARVEVRRVVGRLDAREQEVLARQAEGATNEEIGRAVGVSRERVRQIANEATRSARRTLRRAE